MPAPRVSQKLSGKPKGPAQRGIRFGSTEIDPAKLNQITLNRDAIQALTLAQAKVQVTISGGGTTAILVSEETGKQIGGLDDLAKLLGLRAFVTKEKKASASSDVQNKIFLAAFRAHEYLVAQDPSFQQKKLDSAFIVAAKPYGQMAELLVARLASFGENYNEAHQEYKTILGKYCRRTMAAVASTLAEMVKGEKEKGKFDSFLFDKGVPAYVKNKLLTKSLAITKDTDLSRVLFPQDPSKGLSLTVKEWRDEAFCDKQGLLMAASGGIIKILRDDELFLELIGMTAEQFSNAEDPRVQRVLKTRILVVPPFSDHKRVLEPLSKPNFRGFSLPATAMDQSKDRLSNLCAVFIRAYAFSVRMAETIPDFFDRVFPKGTIKPADDTVGNYAKQCIDAIDKGIVCELSNAITLVRSNKHMLAWIDRECKIIPNGDLHKKIAAVLTTVDTYERPTSPTTMGPIPTVPFVMTDEITTGTEKDNLRSFKESAFALRDKTVKKKRTTASSVLSRGAKTFLKNVAKEHSSLLASSLEDYFRAFYSAEIQAAAVSIAEARFDEIDDFIEEVGSSAEEVSTDDDSDSE